MSRFNVVYFEQPAGFFALTVMRVSEIIAIANITPRHYSKESNARATGLQRDPSGPRINEIAEYAGTIDAAFPTSIILSLPEGAYAADDTTLTILENGKADVVDGQHRLKGLTLAQKYLHEDFQLPVVFLLDATEEQKALIFAIINGKQTKVPASLVYDLFGVAETRSPFKTAHEIARALNNSENSALKGRLKMLGKKEPGSKESLSQGTFIKFLINHISNEPVIDMDTIKRSGVLVRRPECIFNEYFVDNADQMILKILLNLFSAAKKVWPMEWENPGRSILTKTTGFTGIMAALPAIYKKGVIKKDLSERYFEEIFLKVKENLISTNRTLTSASFPPSARSEGILRDIIVNSIPTT